MAQQQGWPHGIDLQAAQQALGIEFLQAFFWPLAVDGERARGIHHQMQRALHLRGQCRQAGFIAQIPIDGVTSPDGLHIAAARVGAQGLHKGLANAAAGTDHQRTVALRQAVQGGLHRRPAASYTQRKPMYTA